MEILIWIIAGYVLAAISFLAAFYVSSNSKNRKKSDKTPAPSHKSLFKSPTWRFQKFNPASCPHHNGIYRSVELRVLDKTIKKNIFVCADCVAAIEIDELKERDKFKANESGVK